MNSNKDKENMRAVIDAFIANPSTDYPMPLENVSPSEAVGYMESMGFEVGDIDCNGWQWDYWIELTKDDISYTLSGSGYYGDIKLTKTEE